MSDVEMGLALVFKVADAKHIEGLRTSPVGFVEEKGKENSRDLQFDLRRSAK